MNEISNKDFKKNTSLFIKEKLSISNKDSIFLILSFVLFLFLLTTFIFYFTAPIIATKNLHISKELASRDYIRGVHLLFMFEEGNFLWGYFSLSSIIMLITNSAALILSVIVPILKLKNKFKPILLVIEPILVFIATVSLILIPMTTFYKGDYLSPSCFDLYVTYTLSVIFLSISLLISLSILFIYSYTKDKKKPLKASTYITTGSILALSGLVALSSCLVFTNINSSKFLYRTINNNTEVEILGIKDKDSRNVNIPDEINGLPVTSIGKYSFIDCHYIRNVNLPKTLNNIDRGAFAHCTSLFTIVIPESVTSINSLAFCHCLHLTIYCEVETLPSGYSSGWCGSARAIYWGGEWEYDSDGNPIAKWRNSYYTEGLIFRDRSVAGYEGSDTNVVIPYGIISIRYRAFYNCTYITSIIIPGSVGLIRSRAFEGCTSLTIYCEAESRLPLWEAGWNNSKRPVYWGGEWDCDSNGIPYPLI